MFIILRYKVCFFLSVHLDVWIWKGFKCHCMQYHLKPFCFHSLICILVLNLFFFLISLLIMFSVKRNMFSLVLVVDYLLILTMLVLVVRGLCKLLYCYITLLKVVDCPSRNACTLILCSYTFLLLWFCPML